MPEPIGATKPDTAADAGRRAAQLPAWRELWRILLSPPAEGPAEARCGEAPHGHGGLATEVGDGDAALW